MDRLLCGMRRECSLNCAHRRPHPAERCKANCPPCIDPEDFKSHGRPICRPWFEEIHV